MVDAERCLVVWGEWQSRARVREAQLGFASSSPIARLRDIAPPPESVALVYRCRSCGATVQKLRAPPSCPRCGGRSKTQFYGDLSAVCHGKETRPGFHAASIPDNPIAEIVDRALGGYEKRNERAISIIKLKYIKKLSFRQIADDMTLNEKTVRLIADGVRQWLDGYLSSLTDPPDLP